MTSEQKNLTIRIIMFEVSAVQSQQTVLARTELHLPRHGPHDWLFRLVFPHQATQQRSTQDLPQPQLPFDIPLRSSQLFVQVSVVVILKIEVILSLSH